MKILVLLALCCGGCTADVFATQDDADPPLPSDDAATAFPRFSFLRSDASAQDAGEQDVAQEGASCALVVSNGVKASFCSSLTLCVETNAVTCNAQSNVPCVADGGLYAECFAPSDCAPNKICALVNTKLESGCPLGVAFAGASASCADPSYLQIFPQARVLCANASDCGDAGTKCVARAGDLAPLTGKIVGVCE